MKDLGMIFGLIFIIIFTGCEPSNVSNNTSHSTKKACNKPKEKIEKKVVDAKNLNRGSGGSLGGILIQHADIRVSSDTYIRHYKDKHGTNWTEEKRGRIRVVYDEQKNLLFYIGNNLIKKHRNVDLEVISTSRLEEKYCKYERIEERSIYSSAGKRIVIISEIYNYLNDGRLYGTTRYLSYYPNGKDIGYSIYF